MPKASNARQKCGSDYTPKASAKVQGEIESIGVTTTFVDKYVSHLPFSLQKPYDTLANLT
jgi:hypothetical protein